MLYIIYICVRIYVYICVYIYMFVCVCVYHLSLCVSIVKKKKFFE